MAIGKNPELKEKVTEALQDEKTAAMREELARERRISRAAQIDEIEKGRISGYDDKGNPIDRWEQVTSEANHAMKVDGKSYNTFQSVMFDLIEMYTHLNEAIFQDLKEIALHTGHLLLDGPAGSNFGLMRVYDAIGDKIAGKPDVVLPKLQYLVEVTDEGKLTFGALQRYEGDTIGKAVDDTFKQGVENWLTDMKYHQLDDKWIHETGEELTKAKFNELKNDPAKGLTAVLSGHFEVDLEERPSGPRP